MPGLRQVIKGMLAGSLAFGLTGTVAALWPNPLFVRMTPSGTAELVLLALGAALLGVFTAGATTGRSTSAPASGSRSRSATPP